MQRGINKVILLGNVGNDPEYKHLENNSEVCNIVVATSEVWKDKKGEEQERTEWHRVVFISVINISEPPRRAPLSFAGLWV